MTTQRALLSLRITTDHNDAGPGVPATPLYTYLKLFRENAGLIWRMDGPLGDECETLPRPASVAQAKADARAVYASHGSPWAPKAGWL